MASRVSGSREVGLDMLWLVMPWLLLVVVAGVELGDDIGETPNLRAGSLLSPAPALAAIRGVPTRVLAVSAGALTVGVLTTIVGAEEGLSYHLTILGSVLVVGVASWLASSARVRREARLSQVQRVAQAAQLALLPPLPRRAGDLRFEARYVAAESEARIGGDLYEAVVEKGRTRLIIGDVRGKGLPAIRTASAVLGAFREAAHHEPTPARVALRCSEAVARMELAPDDAFSGAMSSDELFVTALVVEIEGPRLRLVNLGHPLPMLLNAHAARFLGAGDALPPLGLAHLHADGFPVFEREWEPGERLLLYTDGIDEARDPGGRFFPMATVARTLLGTPIDTLPDALLEAVDRHTGRDLLDDAAVVAVEWCASADCSPPSQPSEH